MNHIKIIILIISIMTFSELRAQGSSKIDEKKESWKLSQFNDPYLQVLGNKNAKTKLILFGNYSSPYV